MRSCVLGFGMLALLAVATFVRADEEKVALDKVPKAVLDTVKAKFPNAELKGASTEKEEGKLVYEIELTYQGAHHDVTLTPEGKITLVEKTIAAKDVPAAVSSALEKKYPKATIKLAEELSDGSGKIKAYEFQLATADKKTVEAEFDPQGKFLKEEIKKGEKD